MFKNKFFWYGLGIGLIVASLLLQLASMSDQSKDEAAEAIDWDILFNEQFDELTQAAESQGYILLNVNELEYIDQPNKSEQSETPNAQPETSVEHPIDVQPETTVLEITYGMTSIDVAELLEELKLIEARDMFEETMAQRGLNRRIQIGTYEFTESPELNELIDLITK